MGKQLLFQQKKGADGESKKSGAFETGKLLILFALLQLVVVVLFFKAGLMGYETNDDVALNAFVSGSFDDIFRANRYNHVLYCAALYGLYRIFPVVNWMTVSYLITACLSYEVIAFAWVSRDRKKGFWLSLFFFLATFAEIYGKINFTRIAFLAALAGILLIYGALFFLQKKVPWAVCGILLLVWGICIRYESAFLTALLLLCPFLGHIRELNKGKIAILVTAAAACLGVFAAGQAYYSGPGWAESLERSNLLSGPIDYGSLQDRSGIDWEKLGITEEDLDYFLDWHISDKEVFPNELLGELNRYEIKKPLGKRILTSLHVTGMLLVQNLIFLAGLLLALIAKKRRQGVLILGAEYLLTILGIAGLVFANRPLDRVTIIPVICSFAVAAEIFLESETDFRIPRAFALTSVVLCVASPLLHRENTSPAPDRKGVEELESLKRETDPAGEKDLFVLNSMETLFRSQTGENLFRYPGKGILENCVLERGWTSILPHMYERLEEFGSAESPYEAALNSDAVYFVDDEAGLPAKLDYIRRNYEDKVDFGWVFSAGDTDAYAVRRIPEIEGTEELARWSIESAERKGPEEFPFFILRGSISDEEEGRYYAIVSSGDREYCYEIRREGDSFAFGIPVNTWEDRDVSISLVRKNDRVIRDQGSFELSFADVN